MEAIVRPSSDLKNHYSEISKACHENRQPVIITVNGRGDTVVLGLQDYYQMKFPKAFADGIEGAALHPVRVSVV